MRFSLFFTLIWFLLSHGLDSHAQFANRFEALCLTPPPPPKFQAIHQQANSSRSGNHYAIPFDTVVYNETLGSKGFDVVVCFEGVVNDTQIVIADSYVDSLITRFQQVKHYGDRFKYFNIYRIARYSNEQGAAWGFSGDTTVDNRYGTHYNAYGLPRLIVPEKLDTLYADINEFVEDFDLVLLLVYDKKYGGSALSYYDGRKVACFGIDEETGYFLSDEVAIHEMQHIMPFAGHGYLGDEYEDSLACLIYDTIPESPNVTADTIGNRKWQHCIGVNGVGFYAGAGICQDNYRPVDVCAMRQVYNFPGFCPVCQEHSTAYFDSIINPVYYSTPHPASYSGNYIFRVEVDTFLQNMFNYEWFFDDSLIADEIFAVQLNFDSMDRSLAHVLRFDCTDMDTIIIDNSLRRPWGTTWHIPVEDSISTVAENVLQESEVMFYPNPASGYLCGKLHPDASVLVEVKSVENRTVATTMSDTQGQFQLNFASLMPGLYFLEIRTAAKHLVRKFIKL